MGDETLDPKPKKTLSVWDATEQAENDFKIPKGLLRGLGMEESYGLNQWDENGNIIASGTGPRGVFQFTKKTAAEMGINRDDAMENILGGAKYLVKNYQALKLLIKDDTEAWLAAAIAHNRGIDAVQGMIQNGRFTPSGKDSGNGGDTQTYATKILNNWAKLRGDTSNNPMVSPQTYTNGVNVDVPKVKVSVGGPTQTQQAAPEAVAAWEKLYGKIPTSLEEKADLEKQVVPQTPKVNPYLPAQPQTPEVSQSDQNQPDPPDFSYAFNQANKAIQDRTETGKNFNEYLKALGKDPSQATNEDVKNFNEILKDSQNRANEANRTFSQNAPVGQTEQTAPQNVNQPVSPNVPQTPEHPQGFSEIQQSLRYDGAKNKYDFKRWAEGQTEQMVLAKVPGATADDVAEAQKLFPADTDVKNDDVKDRVNFRIRTDFQTAVANARDKRLATKKATIANLIASNEDLSALPYDDLAKQGISFDEVLKEFQNPSDDIMRDAKAKRDIVSQAQYHSVEYYDLMAKEGLMSREDADKAIEKEKAYREQIQTELDNQVPLYDEGQSSPFFPESVPYAKSKNVDTFLKNEGFYSATDFLEQRERERQANIEAWKKVAANPNSATTEFLTNLTRTLPKAVSALSKSVSIGAEGLEYLTSQNGTDAKDKAFYQLGTYIDRKTDEWLPQDPVLRRNFLVSTLPDTLGQLFVQLGAGALTGGVAAPLLLGATQGAVQQYEDASSFLATKGQRLLAGLTGAVAAVPDVLLQAKWLKFLSPAEKAGFLGNLINSFFGKITGGIGEIEAKTLAGKLLKNMITGGLFEGIQEVSENKIDDFVASLTYDKKRKVLTINDNDIESFIGGVIGGVAGGGVETAIENYNENELHEKTKEEFQNKILKIENNPLEDVNAAVKQSEAALQNAPNVSQTQSPIARREQLNRLYDLGYSDKQIDALKPNDADVIIQNKVSPQDFEKFQQTVAEQPAAPSPVPERSVTLAAQEKALNDNNSSSVAVLYPTADQIPEFNENKFFAVPVDNGTLLVNEKKIKDYFNDNRLGRYHRNKAARLIGQGKINAMDLIGGKAFETSDTSALTNPLSLVTVDANGNELGASVLNSDDLDNSARAQAELDAQRLGTDTKSFVVPTTEITDARKENRPVDVSQGKIVNRLNIEPKREANAGANLQNNMQTSPETQQSSEKSKAPKPPREFSTTQVDFSKKYAKEIQDFGKKLIDEKDVLPDGREDKTHATVNFGLHTDSADDVRPIFDGEKPVTVTLGKTSIFPAKAGQDYDVVKIDVDSPDLHRLNKKIGENTKTTKTQPEYVPHVTLARVKAGTGEKYANDSTFEGKKLTFDAITFSDKNRQKTQISLGESQKIGEKAETSHNQTETDNDIEKLSISERVKPSDIEGVHFTRPEVAKSVNNEKISNKTGFTPTQTEWFVKETQKAWDKFDSGEVKPSSLSGINEIRSSRIETAEQLGKTKTQLLALNYAEELLNKNPDPKEVVELLQKKYPYVLDWRERDAIESGNAKLNGDYTAKIENEIKNLQDKVEEYKQTEREVLEDVRKKAVVIDVPGDGTFTFISKEGVNVIHKRLTGKTVEEFRVPGFKSLQKIAPIPTDNFTKFQQETKSPNLGKPSKQRQEDLALEQRYQDLSGKEFEVENDKDRAEIKNLIAELENPQRATKPETQATALKSAIPSDKRFLEPQTNDADYIFGKTIDKILSGEISQDKTVGVGQAPWVLQALGIKDRTVAIDASLVNKASRDRHDVKLSTFRKLPSLLANPVMVFDSDTEDNAVVVVLDESDKNGYPVIAAIHLDKQLSRAVIHNIASIYGKDRLDAFEKWVNKGNLRYFNTKKLPVWNTSHKLQLPRVVQTKQVSSIIKTEQDFVKKPENPTTLKSAIAPLAQKSQDVFYSHLEKTISEKMPVRASAEQVKGIINNSQTGIKQEELAWMGINEFLDSKDKVSKEEVLDFIRANQVDVQEVVKGEVSDKQRNKFVQEIKSKGYEVEYDENNKPFGITDQEGDFYTQNDLAELPSDVEDLFNNLTNQDFNKGDTKHSQYQLEGEKQNYKELLLTMPPKDEGFTLPENWATYQRNGKWEIENASGKVVATADTEYGAVKKARPLFPQTAKLRHSDGIYTSRHFSEPNILAHIRFNERTDTAGKKTLFIEEIQSDFAQSGRKKGFRSESNLENLREELKRAEKEYNKLDFVKLKLSEIWATPAAQKVESLKEQINKAENAVPDMPFKKTESWSGLAFKRALRYAAENGFDSIAWTTGAQQNERYDLSKQIDSITYLKHKNGNYDLIVYAKSIDQETRIDNLTESALEDNVGKELADKIIKNQPGESGKGDWFDKSKYELGGHFQGDDLKIAGQGMKGFYDKILPSFVNKYVKKWGAKVGTSNLTKPDAKIERKGSDWIVRLDDGYNSTASFNTEAEAEDFVNNSLQTETINVPVHSVEITPAMRESVLAGQPLFKKRDAESYSKLTEELPKAHVEDVLSGMSGGIFSGDNLDINEHDSEMLRRLIGEANFRAKGSRTDEIAFDGITFDAQTLKNIVPIGREMVKEFTKAGYSETDIEAYSDLLDNLEDLATRAKDFGVAYVFDEALPEELFHQEDLRSGRTAAEAVQQLKQSPFWTNTGDKFNSAYPVLLDSDKASEIAAKLATDQAANYGWDKIENFEAEKEKFLTTWAEGILRRNEKVIQSEGIDNFLNKFERIKQYAALTDSYKGRTAETGRSESPLESSAPDSGQQTEAAEGSTHTVDNSAETNDRQKTGRRLPAGRKSSEIKEEASALGATETEVRTKNRRYAETLRENGRDAEDVPYIPEAEKQWIDDAKEILRKSRELADENGAGDYDYALEQFNSPEIAPGAKTALGIALIDHLGAAGENAQMLRVAEITTKHVGTAAQALRASQLVSKYDFAKGIQLAQKALENRGKTLSDKDIAQIKDLTDKYATSEQMRALAEHALREAGTTIDTLKAEKDEINDALGEKDIELGLKDRTIRNLKRQLKRWKNKVLGNSQTGVRMSRTQKELASRKSAILERLKDKFPETMGLLKSAVNSQLLAPNGRPSNLSPKLYDLVRTEEFKKWSNNWKDVIKDANGEPQVVYHGSPDMRFMKNDAVFKTSRERWSEESDPERAFFFTDSRSKAKSYADPRRAFDYQRAEEGVIETFVKISNPLEVNARGSVWRNFQTEIDGTPLKGTREIVEYAQKNGFDGVAVKNVRDNYENNVNSSPGNVYTVFSSNQIKSVENEGTFDDNNPSILKNAVTPETFDDDTRRALTEYAALQIFDGVPYKELIKNIDGIANGVLTADEIKSIHSDADLMTRGEKVERTGDVIARLKAKNEHHREANAFRDQNHPNLNRLEREILNLAKGDEAAGAAAVVYNRASGRADWSDNIDKIQPNLSAKQKDALFVKARELRDDARNSLAKQRIETQKNIALSEDEFEKIKAQQLRTRANAQKHKQTLDQYYRHLQKNLFEKALDVAQQVTGVPKGLSATGEVSMVFRQNLLLWITHPLKTGRGLEGLGRGLATEVSGIKSNLTKGTPLGNFIDAVGEGAETQMLRYMEKLRNHPYFQDAQIHKLEFSDIGDFNIADEHFVSTVFNALADAHAKNPLLDFVQLPVRVFGKTYKAIELANTLFGDQARLETYAQYAQYVDSLAMTPAELRTAKRYAADVVNKFSGRGDVSGILAAGGTLSKLVNMSMFSARLLVSRPQSLYYLTTGFALAPKGLKMQMAADGLKFYSFIALLAVLAGLRLDPDDKDFGKIKYKPRDMNIDVLAGMDAPLQWLFGIGLGTFKQIGAMNRGESSSAVKDSFEKLFDKYWFNRGAAAKDDSWLSGLRYWRGKSSPAAGLLVDYFTGKDFIGRDFNWTNALKTRLIPLAYQQTYESMYYDRYASVMKEPSVATGDLDVMNGLITFLGSGIGFGISQYPNADQSDAARLAWDLSEPAGKNKKKTDTERRVETGLRNLFKMRKEQIENNQPTANVDKAITKYAAAYSVDKNTLNKLKGQAEESGFAYVTKKMDAADVEKILKVANDKERPELEKILAKKQLNAAEKEEKEETDALVDSVRSGEKSLTDGKTELRRQLKDKEITEKQFDARVKLMKMSEVQEKARNLDASKESDFIKIDEFLQTVGADDRQKVRKILMKKANSKLDTGDAKDRTDAKKLKQMINKYLPVPDED